MKVSQSENQQQRPTRTTITKTKTTGATTATLKQFLSLEFFATPGTDAIKKFTPSLGIPSLGV